LGGRDFLWPERLLVGGPFSGRDFRGPELSMAESFSCQGLLVAGSFLVDNFGGLDFWYLRLFCGWEFWRLSCFFMSDTFCG
jgi:hypothetical protein